MSCCSCSNTSFTCNNVHFSMPQTICAPAIKPGTPAHYFNLYCPNYCLPINCGKVSPNHGISCNAFNGYNPATFMTLPGHTPSCPSCNTCCNCQGC